MPIRGLTDRAMAFPEIGRIRKGAPKGANKPGADLDYFRVEFDEAEKEAADRFSAAYPEQPRELNIRLPFNTLTDVWDAWMEAYLASGLVHRSDGERVWFHIDPLSGHKTVIDGMPQVEDAVLDCPSKFEEPVAHYLDKNSKQKPLYAAPVGRLRVIIPELRRLAYLTLATTSQHDIANLTAQLTALREVHNVAWIPLKLRRRPKMISVPMPDGSRQRMEKWLLSIEADPEWVDAKLIASELEATPQIIAGRFRELPAPAEEDIPTQPTPWQPETQQHPPLEAEVDQAGGRREFPKEFLEELVTQHLAADLDMAKRIMERSPWTDKAYPVAKKPVVIQWIRWFNGFIDESMKPEAAAKRATDRLRYFEEKGS